MQAELTVASAKGVFPSSQVVVTVTVLDVNEDRPTFSQTLYTGTVCRSAAPGTVVSTNSLITVHDHDQVR